MLNLYHHTSSMGSYIDNMCLTNNMHTVWNELNLKKDGMQDSVQHFGNGTMQSVLWISPRVMFCTSNATDIPCPNVANINSRICKMNSVREIFTCFFKRFSFGGQWIQSHIEVKLLYSCFFRTSNSFYLHIVLLDFISLRTNSLFILFIILLLLLTKCMLLQILLLSTVFPGNGCSLFQRS